MARGWVRFKTRRGRKVEFKLTGRGHRVTAWNRKVGKAGRACKRAGRVGTKSNRACLRKHLAT